MAKRLAFALALMLSVSFASPARADEAMTLAQFARQMEFAAEAVERGTYREAVLNAPRTVLVATPGGAVEVDLGWVAHDLATPPGAEQAARIAAALRRLAADARAVADAGGAGLEARLRQAEADRELARRILEGAGFNDAGEAKAPSWLSRLWQRFLDWLEVTFGGDEEGGTIPAAPETPWVRGLGLAGVLAVVGVLAVLAYQFLGLGRRARRSRVELPQALHPHDPELLRRRALELEDRGQRREAIKLLMQAVVGRLAQRRLIQVVPTLTNRRYLSQMAARRPDLAQVLDELNRLYEWKVFGLRPATAAEFQRGVELAGQLWEEVPPSAS